MIKNAKELAGSSKESFRRAYLEYFKDVCVFNKYKRLPKSFNKAVLRLNANRYVNEMLRRIENGDSISYVSIFGEVNAFMTAYTEGTTATITHIFCEGANQNAHRNMTLLNVYSALVRHLRAMGITIVEVKASFDDPVLIDILDSLDFDETSISPTEIEYSKTVPEQDEEKSHGSI